jgi:hypothetical protein
MFSYQDANQQVVGPLPADAIRQLITAGAVGRHTLVRAYGEDFWQPAVRFAEFRALFEQINAPESTAVEPESTNAPATSPTPVMPPKPGEASAPDEQGRADRSQSQSPPAGSSVEPGRAEPVGREAPPPIAEGKYYMVGGDGREYGPVSAAQLREWIVQRRADGGTKVRRDDHADFAPLSAWPEFADVLPSRSGPRDTPKPPRLDGSRSDQLADEIIGRGIDLSVCRCFSRAWRLYLANFALLTGTTARVILLLFGLQLVPVAGTVAAIAMGGVFAAGLSLVFLKTIRGHRAEVNDVFAGFSRGFVPLLLAGMLVFILVSAGLLCVLPGVYLAVAWLFVYPLVFERSLDFWPAMELSRRVAHERWWELFALAAGAVALVLVGMFGTYFVFGVGVFLTAPIAFGAVMYAYEDIFGAPAS